jgi:hypothetical protein
MAGACCGRVQSVPVTIRPRLGQGAFRVEVTDAYTRRCAITGEKTLSTLEAERHGRNIGFPNPSQLVRAWKAGYAVLLLDGFDEERLIRCFFARAVNFFFSGVSPRADASNTLAAVASHE